MQLLSSFLQSIFWNQEWCVTVGCFNLSRIRGGAANCSGGIIWYLHVFFAVQHGTDAHSCIVVGSATVCEGKSSLGPAVLQTGHWRRSQVSPLLSQYKFPGSEHMLIIWRTTHSLEACTAAFCLLCQTPTSPLASCHTKTDAWNAKWAAS